MESKEVSALPARLDPTAIGLPLADSGRHGYSHSLEHIAAAIDAGGANHQAPAAILGRYLLQSLQITLGGGLLKLVAKPFHALAKHRAWVLLITVVRLISQ